MRKLSLILCLLALPAAQAVAAEFNLDIDRKAMHVTGQPAEGIAINGSIPGPLLRMKQGEQVVIHVTNHLDVDTSLHWHGLIVPSDMDGVPGLSFTGIKSGETFTYRFTPQQSGTYWYHSHSGLQEQAGVYGPIIIEPNGTDPVKYDREYIVMLSDWTDEKPEAVLRHLKSQSDYYKNPKRTLVGLISELSHAEPGQGRHIISERLAFARMRMDPTDITDVTGYTFLMNGRTPAQNWRALFKPGERVRLRFINASSASYFDIAIPGLKMQVVAADGQNVQPVAVDRLPIAIAETYDVVVTPTEARPFTIFAESWDRSGYARGTLSPQPGLEAPVPPMDARKVLTMAEVMPSHGMHGMHGGMKMDMPMGHGDHAAGHMMPHDPKPVVLTYADLKSLVRTDGKVTREITLRLTGNMERYFWSFNDVKYSMAKPIEFHFGERVRVRLVNETMMNHPIHLHGLWQVLQNGQQPYAPKKHTINVPPMQTVVVEIPVNHRGRWALHCHILYHMATGMFREVEVK